MSQPHSIMSSDPVSEQHHSHCNVAGCARSSGRYIFVCGDHWLLIEPNTRAGLTVQWESYVEARKWGKKKQDVQRDALVRFYSIARREALPQIRAALARPLVLAEAHP